MVSSPVGNWIILGPCVSCRLGNGILVAPKRRASWNGLSVRVVLVGLLLLSMRNSSVSSMMLSSSQRLLESVEWVVLVVDDVSTVGSMSTLLMS